MIATADIEKLDETLSPDDLVDVVRAKRDRGSVVGALKQFRRVPIGRRREVFQSVLGDTKQHPTVRRTVARELGAELQPENQAVLLRSLKVKQDLVLASVAQSLGRIGDEKALDQLEKVDLPARSSAAAAVGFAKTLIGYRHRLDKHLIDPPPESKLLEVADPITFRAGRAKPETVQEALGETGRELPAVRLTAAGATRLVCGSDEFLLLFAEEFQSASALATLRSKSALPMVLLKKGLSLERYSLSQYFFTQPSGQRGGIVLLGTRPGGALTYVGSVQAAGNTFSFTLKSVESRYAAPLDVAGRYNAGTRALTLSRSLSGVTVAAKARPAATPREAA